MSSWHKKIVGHKACRKRLHEMNASQNIPHALLFSGPKDIGKFRIARHFAQILNSDNQEVVREIEKNISSDVIVMGDLWQSGKLENWDIISKTSNFAQRHRTGKEGEVARRTDAIGIRDIQSFLEPLSRQGRAKWKVGIIRDAHRLTIEAANALLKTLEEPPSNTVFLLTANHKSILPETIVSRCQNLSFGLHPQKILDDYISGTELGNEDNRDQMLMIAQGRSEHLFRLLEEKEFYENEKQQFQEISRFFLTSSYLQKIKTAEMFSSPEHAGSLQSFLDNFSRFLRSVLVEKALEKPLEISQKISYQQILALLEEISNTQRGLRANANKKLLLEHFLFQLPTQVD